MDNADAPNLDNEAEPVGLVTEISEPVDKAMVLRLVSAAAILVLFGVFALQNTESVEIEFLRWSFQLSKFLLMVLSAVAGVLIWTFAGAYSRRVKKKRS